MGSMVETTVALPKTLFDQVESVAQQLKLTHGELVEQAVVNFVKTYQRQNQGAQTATPIDGAPREIKQGDIYWLQVDEPSRAEPGYPHPHVVIQDDAINGSRINTVVVCALTSNLRRGAEPGNLVLEVGEANLSRQSVVVISQVECVAKTQLGEYIGSLSKPRIEQILAGMRFQQVLFSARYQAR